MFRDIMFYLFLLQDPLRLPEWFGRWCFDPLNLRLTMGGGGRRDVAKRVGRGATDAEIGEAVFHHDLRIVEVASVDDDGITQGLVEAIQVQFGELGPVGQDE